MNRQLVNLIIKEKDFQKRQFFLKWSTDLSILILRDRLFQSLYSYVSFRQMDEIRENKMVTGVLYFIYERQKICFVDGRILRSP